MSSGRWQVRYTDPLGVRRTGPRPFDTRREAEEWLARIRTEMTSGTYLPPEAGALTLAEFSAEWLALRVELAPTTRRLYRDLLRLWLCADLPHPGTGRPVNLGAMALRDLSPAMVATWHAAALGVGQTNAQTRAAAADRHRRSRALHAARVWARENGHDVSRTGRLPAAVLDAWRESGSPAPAALDLPDTQPDRGAGRTQVAHAYRLLRTMLATAHRDGLIRANPCTLRGAGQTYPAERVPATPAEVEAIAAHMPDRYAAAVHVAAWSGLRAGELFALTRSHVDLDRGTVRVQRALVELAGEPIRFGPPKTRSSLRIVHLPGPIVEILRDHIAKHTRTGPDALVFGTEEGRPLSGGRRSTLFRAACAHVGRHDLRWHDLRHTGATLAAQAGASLRELQARLGHSTIDAAMRYQHATEDRDREIAARLAAMIAPSPRTGAPHLRVLTGGAR